MSGEGGVERTVKASKLKLIATTDPWSLERAVEEIGDALYPRDRDVCIIGDSKYPLVYVFTVLDAWETFRYLVREPPVFVKRAIPVELLLKPNGIDDIISNILYVLNSRGVEAVGVEAKPRRYWININEKRLNKIIIYRLKQHNIRNSRKSVYSLKVEDTLYGVVIALMKYGSDRMRYWRLRRLGVNM